MPGTDEEIFFRCILLGLLLSSLKVKKIFFVDLSVLILAVYFGLGHSLMLSPDYSLNFAPKYFIYAGIWGYVLGWITINNRSILMPVIVHNIADFLVDLTVMVK
jgi:membrane protease YdiL (CAAX protease family)